MKTLLKNRVIGFGNDLIWRISDRKNYFSRVTGKRILLYHGICKINAFKTNTLFITKKKFESQLRLYKKYFQIISLDDFFKQENPNIPYQISLTFDDGFANNYRYVLPLIEKYQVPVTFFITGIRDTGHDVLWNDVLSVALKYGPANFVFRGERFRKLRRRMYVSESTGVNLAHKLRKTGFEEKMDLIFSLKGVLKNIDRDYWLQMDKDQIRNLSLSKWVSIGCHSYCHNDLANLSAEEMKKDLSKSKEFLENIIDKEVKAFAFPYGSYTKDTVRLVKEAGFSQILATDFLYKQDHEDDRMRERLTINPFSTNINQLYAAVNGHY